MESAVRSGAAAALAVMRSLLGEERKVGAI
jgi:hypothetical protein